MTFGMKPKTATVLQMPKYRISIRAAKDLAHIAHYTISQFGIQQARQYKKGFSACFSNLADHPKLGREVDQLAKGLRRFEHQSHVVFYLLEEQDILIIRLLHKKMVPEDSF